MVRPRWQLPHERLQIEGAIESRERRAAFFVTAVFAQKRPEFHESDQLCCCHHRIGPATSALDVPYRPVRNPQDWYRYRYPFVYGQIDARLVPAG